MYLINTLRAMHAIRKLSMVTWMARVDMSAVRGQSRGSIGNSRAGFKIGSVYELNIAHYKAFTGILMDSNWRWQNDTKLVRNVIQIRDKFNIIKQISCFGKPFCSAIDKQRQGV